MWRRLEDNIGDLAFVDFEPDDEEESPAELDAALQDVPDGFVVDLRYSSGS